MTCSSTIWWIHLQAVSMISSLITVSLSGRHWNQTLIAVRHWCCTSLPTYQLASSTELRLWSYITDTYQLLFLTTCYSMFDLPMTFYVQVRLSQLSDNRWLQIASQQFWKTGSLLIKNRHLALVTQPRQVFCYIFSSFWSEELSQLSCGEESFIHSHYLLSICTIIHPSITV